MIEMAHDIAKVPRRKAIENPLQELSLSSAPTSSSSSSSSSSSTTTTTTVAPKTSLKIPSPSQMISLYTYAVEIADETNNVYTHYSN